MKRDAPQLPAVADDSQKIDRANLSEITYRRIRMALMSGQYPPGERLRIATLAEQFGVSITPVREAIFRLVSEGALAMRAATAISVPVLTAKQLREIQLTRMLLEGAAAERAALLIESPAIDALEDAHRAFVRAWGRDPAEASQHNREFHFALATAGDMPVVLAVIEKMWAMMGPSIHMLHTDRKPRRLSVETHQHWAVLQALRRRDAPGAREAIQQDIRLSDVIIEWTERQPAEPPVPQPPSRARYRA